MNRSCIKLACQYVVVVGLLLVMHIMWNYWRYKLVQNHIKCRRAVHYIMVISRWNSIIVFYCYTNNMCHCRECKYCYNLHLVTTCVNNVGVIVHCTFAMIVSMWQDCKQTMWEIAVVSDDFFQVFQRIYPETLMRSFLTPFLDRNDSD